VETAALAIGNRKPQSAARRAWTAFYSRFDETLSIAMSVSDPDSTA
jgi:hypothetical protein